MRLDSNSRAGIAAGGRALARAEKINSSYVSRVLRLTLLAPEVVEAICLGRHRAGITLDLLMKPVLIEWHQQARNLLGGSHSLYSVGTSHDESDNLGVD